MFLLFIQISPFLHSKLFIWRYKFVVIQSFKFEDIDIEYFEFFWIKLSLFIKFKVDVVESIFEFSFSFLYSGGYLYLGISSNGIDFTTLKKLNFYVNPQIIGLDKVNIPINHNFDLEIFGNDFKDYEGYILFVCNNNVKYYYSIVYDTDYSIFVYNVSLSNCSPFQIVKIYLTYDKINFLVVLLIVFLMKMLKLKLFFQVWFII